MTKGPSVKTRIVACTLMAATAVGVVSACGDPVKANRDWSGLGVSVTATATITTVGDTIHEQEQHLRGGLTNGGTGWSSVLSKTAIQADCIRTSFNTPVEQERWDCQVLVNTGDKFYVAQGQTKDGIFGTFTTLDRAGSRSTITITKVREVQPPPAVVLFSVPYRAGQTLDGGRGYLVRISARVG